MITISSAAHACVEGNEHAGVEGNEHAGSTAKMAAEDRGRRAESGYLNEASLSHLTGKTMEARSKAPREWIRGHVKKERRYHPPPGGEAAQGARQGQKGVGRSFLPTLIRPCGNGRASDEDRSGPGKRVLVVWQRREADALPSLRQVSTLDAGNQKTVGEGREGLRVGDAGDPISPSTLPRRASDPGLLGFLEGH